MQAQERGRFVLGGNFIKSLEIHPKYDINMEFTPDFLEFLLNSRQLMIH